MGNPAERGDAEHRPAHDDARVHIDTRKRQCFLPSVGT
jgi:hypothetical protein